VTERRDRLVRRRGSAHPARPAVLLDGAVRRETGDSPCGSRARTKVEPPT